MLAKCRQLKYIQYFREQVSGKPANSWGDCQPWRLLKVKQLDFAKAHYWRARHHCSQLTVLQVIRTPLSLMAERISPGWSKFAVRLAFHKDHLHGFNAIQACIKVACISNDAIHRSALQTANPSLQSTRVAQQKTAMAWILLHQCLPQGCRHALTQLSGANHQNLLWCHGSGSWTILPGAHPALEERHQLLHTLSN